MALPVPLGLDVLAGPALFTWCEPDWEQPWVAEWHNTVSNACFVVVGCATLRAAADAALPGLRAMGAALVLVGLGSMAFHGTMTRWGQAFDELAILWWEGAMLAALFPGRRALSMIAALLAIEHVSYCGLDFAPQLWMLYHPCHGCVDVAVVVGVVREARAQRLRHTFVRALVIGLAAIALGLAAWGLDMFACEAVQSWRLHAWGWHVLAATAIAALHFCFALLLAKRNKRETLRLFGRTFNVD